MSIVFIGTYLSQKKGSKAIAEKVQHLLGKKYDIKICSRKKNKILRFADIFFTLLFFRGKLVVTDMFSGQAFYIAYLSYFVNKRIRRKKMALVLRGGMLAEFYEKNKARVSQVLNGADLVATPSLFLKEFFTKQGFTVQYLPNFVMLDAFKDTGVGRKPFSLLWVRAFRHIYNPTLAVRTLNVLLKQYPQTTLTMVGPDDGLMEECKQLAAQLGIADKISFIGPVKNDELAAYYSSHAVYLNTTSYESFGTAVMEAASCGIPVISTPVGEIPVLWHENEEILLAGFDENEMAGKAAQLFANPGMAGQMAQKAQAKAHSYGWEAVKPKWEEIFSA